MGNQRVTIILHDYSLPLLLQFDCLSVQVKNKRA